VAEPPALSQIAPRGDRAALIPQNLVQTSGIMGDSAGRVCKRCLKPTQDAETPGGLRLPQRPEVLARR
jgi:hypothetical protein